MQKTAPAFSLFTSGQKETYLGLFWAWPQRLSGLHVGHLDDHLQDWNWEVEQKENTPDYYQ